jgi:hypothetical protein
MSDDCLACGVCCFSTLESYVPVSGDDYERIGEAAARLVHFVGNKAFMHLFEGHCAALDVRAGPRRYSCSIYERRPETCRDLGQGSRACLGELEAKALRPGRALVCVA